MTLEYYKHAPYIISTSTLSTECTTKTWHEGTDVIYQNISSNITAALYQVYFLQPTN